MDNWTDGGRQAHIAKVIASFTLSYHTNWPNGMWVGLGMCCFANCQYKEGVIHHLSKDCNDSKFSFFKLKHVDVLFIATF